MSAHAALAQEVLRCLHTHLGSKLPTHVDAALAALLQLSREHADALLDYAAFLSSLMEYLEDLTSEQLLLVPLLWPCITASQRYAGAALN